MVADFSAIEARVIAWFAGEKWRQDVFAKGGDIYCASASQMFKVPVEKHGINGHLRQKGKIAELALGYGGSVGALKAMGALDMGLTEDELPPLVDAWRQSNPNIVKFWWNVDRAVMEAVKFKHTTSQYGLTFSCRSGMLFITLPLSAEAYSKHGFNIHGVVFDELHTQPNRKLFDVMTKGSGDARMQPLYFLITTAGTDTNSICYETHQKAKDILEGRKIDPTFYPVIYGAAETDDWTNPEVWKKANPSLGITVGIDKVEAACESAKQNPGEENSFRQLRLNQWVKQAVRWMPMEKWDACSFKVDEESLEGRVCYGGLDLSSTTDITAFVLVFPPLDEDDKFCILPYFWIPEDTLDLRVRRDHVPYDVWERQGFLETTEGNVVHYGYIEKFIERLGERFNIREIAFDRWGAVQMVQNLEGMGFTVVPFGQGFKDMSPPTKELMKLTLEQKLAHGGHPVLRWMMDNIYIRTDPAGNIKADKEKSTEKIDGAVATIMGLDRAIRCGNNTGASVYDERGILFI